MPRVIPAVELERRIEEIDELIDNLQRTRAMYEEILGYGVEIDGHGAFVAGEEEEGGGADVSSEAGVPCVDAEASTTTEEGNHVSCPECFAALNGDGSCSTPWCEYEESGMEPAPDPVPVESEAAGEGEADPPARPAVDADPDDWLDLTDYQRNKMLEAAREGSVTMQARSRAMLLDAGLVKLGMDDRVRLLDDGRELLVAAGYDPDTGEAFNGGPR